VTTRAAPDRGRARPESRSSDDLVAPLDRGVRIGEAGEDGAGGRGGDVRSGDGEPGATPAVDDAVRAPVDDLDRVDPADARPPLEVLASIELASVLSLGQEGTERVDWAALVPDRTGLCRECGLPDGRRHRRRCLAHPPATNLWGVVLACLLLPLPLTLVAGPYAFGFFVPTIALALYIRTR
jgi:hypothetical protein